MLRPQHLHNSGTEVSSEGDSELLVGFIALGRDPKPLFSVDLRNAKRRAVLVSDMLYAEGSLKAHLAANAWER
jgi:hypothetical protein